MPNSIADAGFLTPEEKEVWAAAVASTDSGGSPPPADPRHSGGGGGRGGSGAGSGDGKAAAPAQGSWAALRSALTCPVVFCAGTWRGFYATALYGGARARRARAPLLRAAWEAAAPRRRP
jgi:hypothetical protein